MWRIILWETIPTMIGMGCLVSWFWTRDVAALTTGFGIMIVAQNASIERKIEDLEAPEEDHGE